MSGTFLRQWRTSLPKRVGGVGGVVLVALGITSAGYLIGSHGDASEWRDGVAHVGQDKASFETPSWVYGIDHSVAWIDAVGAPHQGGWPECLDAPAGTTIPEVRFATVDEEVDGLQSRPVVLVDCRKP